MSQMMISIPRDVGFADADESPRAGLPGRGLFIVLEGIDRSGKTTQTTQLVAKLRANRRAGVIEMRFPDYNTPTGVMLRNYLQSKLELPVKAAHMLFCANRWECAAKVEADLAAGKIIVCDRYSASGVAYSAAKGASLEFCLACEAGLPQPDLVIFLFVKPEVTALRAGYDCDTDRHEVLEFQKLVAARYLSSDVTSMTKNWSTVNADRSTEEVAFDVYRIATEALDNRRARVERGLNT